MRLLRQYLALVLTAIIAGPAPALAQNMRLAVEGQVRAPALAVPVPFALSVAGTSMPIFAPLSAPVPVLLAPAIAASPSALPPGAAALIIASPSAPSAPERPSEAQKADADRLFEGSWSHEAAVPVAVETAVSQQERPPAHEFDLKLSALGRVPAPRPWLEKSKVLLAYGGLTAAAVGMNAPFEHIGPMIVGAIMAPMLSFMGLFFYSASQSVSTGASLEGEAARPSGETMAMIVRLAAEAKVPAPARVKLLPGDQVQAQVGARDEAGYEIRFTKAFESLRPEVKEAILRHEFAHERHHDMAWKIVNIFMAPLPVMIGLMAMDGKASLEGVVVGAIAAAAILLFPVSLQRSEYLADQYAASKPEGAGPLARFFVEDSDNASRAASALSGVPYASETGWKRGALTAWDYLKRTVRAHPSHDRRIARLARLAEKEKARVR